MSLTIGPVELPANLFLAPLAGYTDLAFRLMLRELGGLGLATTDLVNARSLLENHRPALALIRTTTADQPLAVQLYGTRPAEMRDAALWLQDRGVMMVDVNMGCPARKVCRHGGGAALLGQPALARRIVETMVAALKIPVTCKLRLGLAAGDLAAPELARALADAGAAAITVHGRTRQQGFTGAVNRAGIRAVVEATPRIPVVGNGDIVTPADAKQMFDETGCAAVSIGRGAFYDPWLFARTRQFLATGALSPGPTFEERLTFMARHLDGLVGLDGEEHACRQFRKVALAYLKPLGPVAEFRKRVVNLRTRAEFDEIVATYRVWRERVLAKAQPASGSMAPVPSRCA
jgi:nifR3 family TIM-barrel protein